MDKIQEITSKLFLEGVEKGKEEAEKIISQAQAEAQKILDAAYTKSEDILASAKKESAELKKNSEAELKLYAVQSTEALKTEITNLLTEKLTTTQVKASMADKTFIQQLIVELVKNWSMNDALTVGLENPDELKSYIATNAKELLDKGLKIESVNGVKTGFILSPEDGSYKVKFGEEEFINYFKEFLRPQIQQLLF